jgi:hypothetical protein
MPRSYPIRTSLQSLPVELVCMILENMGMHDLLTCTLVFKCLLLTLITKLMVIIGLKISQKSGN